MLFIVLMASVAAPLNQFKVPPVMPFLMDAFNLPVGRAGLLMSLFSITGLLLALPAGFIYQRLGYRITFSIALIAMIVGSGIGAVAKDTGTMLFSRVVEGIGLCLVTMSAPPLISLLFDAAQRGKAMAIWVVYVPLGQMITFSLAPQITAVWGWRSVWWWSCVYTLVVGLLFCFFVKPPPETRAEPEARLNRGDIGLVLRNRDLWLLGFLFLCFNFVFIAFRTWMPTFLYQVKDVSTGYGSFLMALMSVFIIASSPFTGWVCDRIGSRRLVCLLPMFVFMVMLPLSYALSPVMLLPWLSVLGVICSFLPTGVFLVAAELIRDQRLGGLTMAVVQLGQNAGMLLGPFLFGWIVGQTGSWEAAFWVLAPVSAIGAAAMWATKVK